MTTYNEYEASNAAGKPVELYDFQDVNGNHWRLNTSTEAISYGGYTYEAGVIDRDSDIIITGDGSQSTIEVSIKRGFALTRQYIARIIDSIITLTIYRQQVDQYVTYWQGTLKEIKRDKNGIPICVLEPLITDESLVGSRRQCQLPCTHIHYDELCTLQKSSYAVSGTITYVSDDGLTIQADEFATKANDWFKAGTIEIDGVPRFILSHTTNTIIIDRRFYADIEVGNSCIVYAGCDLLPTTCDTKYNNKYNFGGCEFLPEDEIQEIGIT